MVDQKLSVLYTAFGGLRGWRLGDGLQHHLDTTSISSLALSPDDRLLAIGDGQGVIHILFLKTWQELTVLEGFRSAVTRLVFSPDSTSLLSTSCDGTIRLWGLP